ncbi:MAG: phosphodiester glycosidase family protein [Gemmatimonadota bacterium]
MRVAPSLSLALLLLAPRATAGDALAVRVNGAWREWWHADRAPVRWTAPAATLSSALRWHPASPGIEWGDAELSAPVEGWRTKLVVERIDPARHRFALQLGQGVDFAPNWAVDSAGDSVLVAVNAGQFSRMLPWGWLVNDGREITKPGTGALSMALVFDSSGAVRFVEADSIAAERTRGHIANAFQSYPALLTGDGDVPELLRSTVASTDIDLAHRDSRVAIGETRDGRILIAMTRFNALGEAAAKIPFGLTVPEMSALMGALGCRRAVSLDGGISGQLAVREPAGEVRKWTAWRFVPLGLLVLPKLASSPGTYRSTR